MSHRGSIFDGIGVGNPISQSEMLQAMALRQNRDLQEQRYKDEQKNRQEIRKSAAATYLSNVLDKKDFLSGSPYDPMIVQGLDNAMKQGMELASKGADTPTIMLSIAPTIQKLNQYQSTAKQIETSIKSSTDKLKGYSGYNIDALSDEAKKTAYFNQDGTMKDISEIDPQVDYVSNVLKNNPDKVVNLNGINEVVDKTHLPETQEKIGTEIRGKKQLYGYDVKKPWWQEVEKDEKGNAILDPKSNLPRGLDVKNEILKKPDGTPLTDEDGMPFKLVDKKVFNSFMSSRPDVADAIVAETIKDFRRAGAKENEIPKIGSPIFEEHARHTLYTLLKERNNSSFKRNDVQSTAPLLTKIQLTGSAYTPKSGASDKEILVNDVFKEIKDNPKIQAGEAVMLTNLGGNAPEVIVEKAKKRGFNDITQEDIYVHKDKSGVVNVYDRPSGKVIFPLDEKSINLGAKGNTTLKPQQEILKGQKDPTYKIKGKTYTHKELMDMGYTPEQVSQYKQ